MNLLQFHEKISRNDSGTNPTSFFSEQVTMYNVLNGTFPDEDILNVSISKEEDNKPSFAVTLRTDSIAENAENNLDKMIVPGAYRPLYELEVKRSDNTLVFKMNEV